MLQLLLGHITSTLLGTGFSDGLWVTPRLFKLFRLTPAAGNKAALFFKCIHRFLLGNLV